MSLTLKKKSEQDKRFFKNGIVDTNAFLDWYLIAVFYSASHMLQGYILATGTSCRRDEVLSAMIADRELAQAGDSFKRLQYYHGGSLYKGIISYHSADQVLADEAYQKIVDLIATLYRKNHHKLYGRKATQ